MSTPLSHSAIRPLDLMGLNGERFYFPASYRRLWQSVKREASGIKTLSVKRQVLGDKRICSMFYVLREKIVLRSTFYVLRSTFYVLCSMLNTFKPSLPSIYLFPQLEHFRESGNLSPQMENVRRQGSGVRSKPVTV